MATTIYSLENGKVDGVNKVMSDDWNTVVDLIEDFFVQLGELIDTGCFKSTDFNGTTVSGLTTSISAGTAIVGAEDSKKLIHITSATEHTLPNSANPAYVWLKTDGTFLSSANVLDQPAGSILIFTAVTSGGSISSHNNAPSGRTTVYPWQVTNGGTGAATAAGARTNLGLGTIATQAASNVAITGGSISGITDLAVADGGTGASNAAGAQTNLGVPPTSRAINTTATHLAGGGDLSSDRTLSLAAGVVDKIGGTPTVSAGAEAADNVQVTIQIKDFDGNNLAEQRLIRIWLSDTDKGAVTATTPSNGLTWNAGTVIAEFLGHRHAMAYTNTSGVVTITIGHNAAKTWYVNAEVLGIVVSDDAVFT